MIFLFMHSPRVDSVKEGVAVQEKRHELTFKSTEIHICALLNGMVAQSILQIVNVCIICANVNVFVLFSRSERLR